MARCGLADFEWRTIEPLLPSEPRIEDQRVLDGIFWILRSESRSRGLPSLLQRLRVRLTACMGCVAT